MPPESVRQVEIFQHLFVTCSKQINKILLFLLSTIISIFVPMKFTFGKQEKLKSRKAIEQLFIEGTSVSSYPMRLVFLKQNHGGEAPVKLGLSVPKKKFNKAVDRNRIKRVLREVYRKNKHTFVKELDGQYIAMLLYLDSKEWDQEALTKKMQKLAEKFLEKTKL